MSCRIKKYWKCLLLVLLALMIVFESDGRTRVITIDGGFDPGPETTDFDRAITGLLDDFMTAFKRHVPHAEERRINSADSLLDYILDMDCECGDTLYFVFSGHGFQGGIGFSKGEQNRDRFLSYREIAAAIFANDPECCCKIHFIINACHSGSAIEPLSREEHVKRVFTATSADALMYYRQALNALDSISSSYLRRLINKMDELIDEDNPIDEVIDEAHGDARDKVPASDWEEGERPEGYRVDTFNVRGHIRNVLYNSGLSGFTFVVIEIYDPKWRRGELDTVLLTEPVAWLNYRKCQWISTQIVYEQPTGLRENIGDLVDADPPDSELISAHVMEVRENRAKVHTTWPRHMFCRELWIDYPSEDIDSDSQISVCRWIQQDVNIIDPTGSATPVDTLRPFGRYLGGLVHITGIDRENGIIEFEVREPWLRRYGYRRARISEEEMEHLDSLIKVRDTIFIGFLDTIVVERTRPLESCDNIWLSMRVPGTSDSSLWVVNGWIPHPRDRGSVSHTRLQDHSIDQSGTLESVLPSIYVLNKDRDTYRGRIHLALYPLDEPSDKDIYRYAHNLDVLQSLFHGSDFSTREGDRPDIDLSVFPSGCEGWLQSCAFPVSLEQIEDKIYSMLKAAYLMNYLKSIPQDQLKDRAPNLNQWKNTYRSNHNSPTQNHYSGQTAKHYQLEFDYKNKISSAGAFSNALLLQSAGCDAGELRDEVNELWSEAKESAGSQPEFSTEELEGLENYFSDYLSETIGRPESDLEERCPDRENCLDRIVERIKQLAVNDADGYLQETIDLSSPGLFEALHQRNPHRTETVRSRATVPDFESSALYTDYVDFYQLEPFETRKVRFNTVSGLEPGRGYRLSFWRGDQKDEGEVEDINTADLNYQFQDTLHLFFYIKKENECQCPDPSVLDIVSTATGQVSGNVFNLKVTNTGDEPVLCELGPYVVPPGKKTQGFILPEKTEISLLPGETTSLEVFGHCMDFDKIPPKKGSTANPATDWIALDGRMTDPNFTGLSPSKSPVSDKVQLLQPGTEELLNPIPRDIKKLSEAGQMAYFKQLGELHLKAGAITRAVYDDFHYSNALHTPYGSSGHLQRYSVLQNLTWVYNSYLTGTEYQFEDFKKQSIDMVRETMPDLNIKDEKTMEEMNSGLRSVWNSSHDIGLRAKLWK
jgi:hypothetical protein